jgi:hypothetical protein
VALRPKQGVQNPYRPFIGQQREGYRHGAGVFIALGIHFYIGIKNVPTIQTIL